MAKKRFDGPKYSNGNHKSQQTAYNRTEKGKSLRTNANKLRRKLKMAKGDPREAGHYAGSTTQGRPQNASSNAARKKPKRRA